MSYRRRPFNYNMVSLKVDNLNYKTTSQDLWRLFRACGEVGDVYIPRHGDTQESKGYAFVRFYEERDAYDAMYDLNHSVVDGRVIYIEMAQHGKPYSPNNRRLRACSPKYPHSRSRFGSCRSHSHSKSCSSLCSDN